jgi:mRNA interferase MazF
VVSNNRRNRAMPQVLGVGLTTTPNPMIPRVVELSQPEAFVGRAVCDDIAEIYEDEVLAVVGALSPGAPRRIDRGLAAALEIGQP